MIKVNNDVVAIELDKTRTLKFRRKELKLLEKVFNAKISKINFSELGIDDVTKIIHTGLVHEDSELTLEQTEDLIDNSSTSFGELTKAAMEAFSIAMGGKKETNVAIGNDEIQLETKN